MNDGFISFICTWFLLLFLWMGFFDRFLNRYQWKKTTVVLLLLLSLTGAGFSISLPDGGEWVVLSFGLPLAIGIGLWVKQGDRVRLHLLTAGFLLGVSVFLLRILLRVDPVLMIMDEKYMLAFFVMLILLVAAKPAIHQFILMNLGLVFGDICFQYYLWEKTGHYVLGGAFFRDGWWLALYFLIAGQIIVNGLRWPAWFKRKRSETTG